MARKNFNGEDDYHGGRVNPEDDKPKRLRYPCFATGCPMPGTIFASGDSGSNGACAWHYGVKANDIPRVTNALAAWQCVSFEVNEARRVLTGEQRSDPAAIQAAFAAAWERLEPIAGTTWAAELAPSTIKHRDKSKPEGFVDSRMPEGYPDWAKRLEAFLGQRVVESLTVNQRRAA